MSNSVHFNLLHDDEIVSSSPVRLRIMLPLLAVIAVGALAVWWLFITQRLAEVTQRQRALEALVAEKQPAYNALLKLLAAEREARAEVAQMELYRKSQQPYTPLLQAVMEVVPPTIQLVELDLPPPPAPPKVAKSGQPKTGSLASDKAAIPEGVPTNSSERVTMKLAGRAGSRQPSEAIATLLDALNTHERTPLVTSADIPKGAFRRDVSGGAMEGEVLLFEITCECNERRFE